MTLHEAAPGLYLVDLDLPRRGFRRFIGSWVLCRGPSALVVDPGPRVTVPALEGALAELGVERLDAVLLTHIHIDHAGGAGLLLARHPETPVVCPPKGIAHLADPARLWEGSRKVLGDLAEAYGEIAPVPRERLTFADALEVGPWRVEAVETPGHAPHHASYRVGDTVFSGEAAGVRFELPSGVYQRPATPPVFQPDFYLASLDRVAGLGAARLCLGHYGLTERPAETLDVARRQIGVWMEAAGRRRAGGEGLEAAIVEDLLAADPHFARLRDLPEEAQARERYFAGNTIAGMLGALNAD